MELTPEYTKFQNKKKKKKKKKKKCQNLLKV